MAEFQEALQQALKDGNLKLPHYELDEGMPDIVIPTNPQPRKPRRNTPEWFEFQIRAIDNRINRVTALGLNPHPNLFEKRIIFLSQLQELKDDATDD